MSLSRASMQSRHDDKVAKLRRKERDRRDAYRLVDIRDGGTCRACGRRTFVGVPGSLGREHHHIRGRQVKDAETTGNLCVLCKDCHDLRHVKRTLVITGNADQMLTFEQDGKVWHG